MSDYDLIIKGLEEVVGEKELRAITSKRPLYVYWGTAPTGRIHIGYYVPLLKVAELVKANCEVTILIADLHALLDSLKSTEKQVQNRTNYYLKVIKGMLTQLGVNLDRIKFVLGSSYQTTPAYTMDVYRLNTLCTLSSVQHAGAEVVKQNENPLMSSLFYPTLQALDEEYLLADAQLGGVDQRKIFMFARKYLPKLGYKKRIHLMTPMVSGLRNTKSEGEVEKMSASVEETKIDILDARADIKRKINKSYCLETDIDDNPVLDLLELILFPLLDHLDQEFVIFRREEHGGPIKFDCIEDVQVAFQNGKLHPADLKAGVINNLDLFIEPIRKEFQTREMKQMLKHL